MMIVGGAPGQEGDKNDGDDVTLSRGCCDETASCTVKKQNKAKQENITKCTLNTEIIYLLKINVCLCLSWGKRH